MRTFCPNDFLFSLKVIVIIRVECSSSVKLQRKQKSDEINIWRKNSWIWKMVAVFYQDQNWKDQFTVLLDFTGMLLAGMSMKLSKKTIAKIPQNMLKINEIAYIWGTKKQEFLFKQENSHACVRLKALLNKHWKKKLNCSHMWHDQGEWVGCCYYWLYRLKEATDSNVLLCLEIHKFAHISGTSFRIVMGFGSKWGLDLNVKIGSRLYWKLKIEHCQHVTHFHWSCHIYINLN